MKQQTCSMDLLIKQVDMSELDRANARAQVRRAEAIVDTIRACVSVVRKLMKTLTLRKLRGATITESTEA